MKKLLQILSATSFCLVLAFSGASSVFAQNSNECVIENTGPGSVNECEIVDEETCIANNGTFVEINNDNDQEAGSGDGESDGNTTGGGATSGDSNNSNETDIVIEVENGSCVFAAAPVTPEPPVTPETPAPAVLSSQTVAPVGGVDAGANGQATLILSLSVLSLALAFAGVSRAASEKF
jgi:hypothetical protein